MKSLLNLNNILWLKVLSPSHRPGHNCWDTDFPLSVGKIIVIIVTMTVCSPLPSNNFQTGMGYLRFFVNNISGVVGWGLLLAPVRTMIQKDEILTKSRFSMRTEAIGKGISTNRKRKKRNLSKWIIMYFLSGLGCDYALVDWGHQSRCSSRWVGKI